MTGCPSSQVFRKNLIDRHVATLFAGEAPALVQFVTGGELLRHDDRLPVKVWTRSISVGEKSICNIRHL